jgi:hypothetical protein
MLMCTAHCEGYVAEGATTRLTKISKSSTGTFSTISSSSVTPTTVVCTKNVSKNMYQMYVPDQMTRKRHCAALSSRVLALEAIDWNLCLGMYGSRGWVRMWLVPEL